jgi:hypothetical protein
MSQGIEKEKTKAPLFDHQNVRFKQVLFVAADGFFGAPVWPSTVVPV